MGKSIKIIGVVLFLLLPGSFFVAFLYAAVYGVFGKKLKESVEENFYWSLFDESEGEE